MAAPQGNRFWELRAKHGRDKIFKTPDALWKAACEYFEYCEDNPLFEAKVFNYQGMITSAEIPKMRAMTIRGLCLFLGVNEAYFRQLPVDFSTIVQQIEDVIYNQKFQGAAADLLNPNIISRELGLKDNSEVTNLGDVIVKVIRE